MSHLWIVSNNANIHVVCVYVWDGHTWPTYMDWGHYKWNVIITNKLTWDKIKLDGAKPISIMPRYTLYLYAMMMTFTNTNESKHWWDWEIWMQMYCMHNPTNYSWNIVPFCIYMAKLS